MKKENIDLHTALGNYNELSLDEMHDVDGGGILKVILAGIVIALVIGIVNGCNRTVVR